MPGIDIAIAAGVGICLILCFVLISMIGALKDRLRHMEMEIIQATSSPAPQAAGETDAGKSEREIKLAKDVASKQNELDKLRKKVKQLKEAKGPVEAKQTEKAKEAAKDADKELKGQRETIERLEAEKDKLSEKLGEQEAKVQRLDAAEADRGGDDEEFARLEAAMDKALTEKNAEIRALHEVAESKDEAINELRTSGTAERETLLGQLSAMEAERDELRDSAAASKDEESDDSEGEDPNGKIEQLEEKVASLTKSEKEFNSLAESMSTLLEEKDDELEEVKEELENLRSEKRSWEMDLVEAVAEKEKRIRELETDEDEEEED
ncbi:MAG: hypothetical protein JRF33_02520 [Deltaproteobacteria bacterium]|nr:hypothetical protein [Deltaproteobacteria bacterium]